MSNEPKHSNLECFGALRDRAVPNNGSVDQLRREAGKARKLADNAFGEAEKRHLLDVAASLEREAAAIDSALAVKAAKASAASFPMERAPRQVTVRTID